MLFKLIARTPFWMNIVAGPTIAYLSIVMNIIIFAALFHKNIRTPTTVLMQGLALADGLTSLCTYGFEPFFDLHYEEIVDSTKFVTVSLRPLFKAKIEEMKRLVALKFPYCVMHYCLSNLVETFHLISILLTTCLRLQKFLAVACPIWAKTQITKKRSAIVCGTCFLLTLTVTIPRLFVVSLSRGKEGYICLVSEPHHTIQKYILAFYPIVYAIMLVLAVVIMLISTCYIIFILCRRKRVRGHVAVSRAEKKSCILIVCVMTVFFLSEVPRIFVSATLFSTYRTNLDRTNVALHLTNTRQFQTYLECLFDSPDDIFQRSIDTRNLSCISDFNEIPPNYKKIVAEEANNFLEFFTDYEKIEDDVRFFKDNFKQYLIDDQQIDLLIAKETANRIQQDSHDLAIELYCANEPLQRFSESLSFLLFGKFLSKEAFRCKIFKIVDSLFILGSSPFSEQMNYILNIVSGRIDITFEHLKLLTEILKFSMVIGCGSNFLIYIIMSEKLRNALKKTFKCGGNQDVRADAIEMQIRR